MHRALLFKAKEWLDKQGYNTVIFEQGGRIEQPDMIAKPEDGGREIAIEVETSANHPEQIIRNYKKNVKQGRFVIFVVPDEETKYNVEEGLSNVGIKTFSIYILGGDVIE